MKTMKMKIINLLMVIFLLPVVLACSKDDSNSPNNASADQVASIAKDGTWKITYFYDTDNEETGNFSGYTFTFNSDGTLVAVNGNTTVTGTWSVTNSNSSSDDDGNSNSDTDFNIFFPVPESHDFEDLNDDWDVLSVNDNTIELIDISGGNGGTDYLTFKKI